MRQAEIKKASWLDCLRLARMSKECFQVPWDFFKFFEELTNHGRGYYIIASDHGTDMGFLGLRIIDEDAHVTQICVREDYRRQGLAAYLLKLGEEEAVRRKAKYLSLEARESNSPAIALYTGYGFRKTGEMKDYYSDNKETAVVMQFQIEETEKENEPAAYKAG